MSKVAGLASGQITTFRVRKNSRRLLNRRTACALSEGQSALVIRTTRSNAKCVKAHLREPDVCTCQQ
jgi:hypothetical protein